MLWTSLFAILLGLAAIAGGVLLWLRTREHHRPLPLPILLRVMLVFVPLAGAIGVFRTAGFLFISPRHDWNAGKLAPVIAMTKGYSLYQDPKTGVMTAWIYGP